MSVTVQVGSEKITVSDAGDLTCSCGTANYCQHVEAVVCGDATVVKPGSLSDALKLIPKDVRIQALTRRLDAQENPAERHALEAAIAQLLRKTDK